MTIALKSRILDSSGRRFIKPRAVRAKYDAAQTSSENVRHWSWTDSMSADAANSPAVRKKLRERARYEVANNGWARSMVETLAHEVIGTGPRIQVLTGDSDADEWIERAFSNWCQQIHLARKFRTMRKAKAVDGEGNALFVNNERAGDIQLDLMDFETERLAHPAWSMADDATDGIDLDGNGNPVRYHVLKYHPGDTSYHLGVGSEEIDPPPSASEVLHIFRRDRPGQHRGISELTPALPLFSGLRRYSLAVLAAAENVAELSMLLKTKHPEVAGDDGYGMAATGTSDTEPAAYTAFDAIDIERNLMMVLPEDTEPFQLDPKQPSTTHVEYVKCILAEAFAAVCMPYSVGAADSSDENFASGKLSRLGFKRAIQIERKLDWNPEVYRVFWSWFAEAKAYMPAELRLRIQQPMAWAVQIHWDGVEDIDPEKAARARTAALGSGQTSYAKMFAEDMGTDWRDVFTDQATCLGLTFEDYQSRLADTILKPLAPEPPNGEPQPGQPAKKGETV